MADVSVPVLSREAAREAALKVQATMQEPNNSSRLDAAQKAASGDISKFFMLCIPLVTEILGGVIQHYGFDANQQGALAFSAELQKHKDDSEILAVANNLKARFMPMGQMPAFPMPTKPPGDEMAD